MEPLDKGHQQVETSDISHLVNILKDDPRNVEIRKQLTEVFERRRDYQAAIGQYRELIEIDPANRDKYKKRISLNEDFSIRGAEQFERLK